ncbi:hypothetical protein NQD34_017076, partial [Periophthalmus magnuspinnatus]
RIIEIGWIHTENKITKQVRAKQGGGTRKVTISTQAGFNDILEQGKSLFFPQGKSNKGAETDFDFEVWDFKQNPLPHEMSVEYIYNTVKLPILRFYLATQPKTVIVDDDDVDDYTPFEGDEEHPEAINNPQKLLPEMQPEVYIFPEDMSTGLAYAEDGTDFATFHVDSSVAIPLDTSDYAQSISVLNATNSDPEITFGPDPTNSEASLSDALIYQPDGTLPPSPQSIIPEVTLILHHANSFSEMMGAFSDDDILRKTIKVKRFLPDNRLEKGSGSGLLKDVYTSFWGEFYERCTLGTPYKVPFLRHDFTEVTWKAIGRIFVKGFQDCGYLPLKVAPPFLEEMLFGKIYSDLIKSFLKLFSSHEQNVINKALVNLDSVDADEITDLLSNYECLRKICSETLPEILLELAHKEIIQKPMFVIDCWQGIAQPHMLLNSEELTKMYSERKPTTKTVAEKLHFPDTMTPNEAEVAQYLKKYIKELSEERVEKFLRFCTGSDLLVSGFIKVEFVVQTAFTSRPIGRTCASLLHLPDSYDNFPDFRSEFHAILDSNIWIMDIV